MLSATPDVCNFCEWVCVVMCEDKMWSNQVILAKLKHKFLSIAVETIISFDVTAFFSVSYPE